MINKNKPFIPEIGSIVRLTKDWEFTVYPEYRNSGLYEKDKGGYPASYKEASKLKPYRRTLPADTELQIARIYVRNGKADFSSVTMYITKTTDKALLKGKKCPIPFTSSGMKHYGRFWVKLEEFNDAPMELIYDEIKAKEKVEVPGEVMLMKEFAPRKKYPEYWVKFEHDDPDLCFDGLVRTVQEDTMFRDMSITADPVAENPDPERYTVGERTSQYYGTYNIANAPGEPIHCQSYKPKFWVPTLVPEQWYKDHESDERFKVKKPHPYAALFNQKFPDVIVTAHPFERKINIPKDKKERIAMGIPDGKAALRDISIEGGKLTIYKVVLE